MTNQDLLNKLDAATTRRAIVKTGAKAAYAAPLIAATYSLSSIHASAQATPGGGGVDPACDGESACLGTPTCGQTGSNCSCATLVGGGGLCRPTVRDCDTPVGCNNNADCATNAPTRPYCVVVDDCCPVQGFAGICTARCPTA